MGKEILMSDQTRELYRPEFIDFLATLKYTPHIIFSPADFDNNTPTEAASEHAVNIGFLEKMGVRNPRLQNTYLSIYTMETTSSDIGAHAWSEEFTDLDNSSREELESLIDLGPKEAQEKFLSLQFHINVMNVVSTSKSGNIKKILSDITKVESENLNSEKVSPYDVRAIVTLHETAHLDQNPESMSRAEREWRAENFAHKAYARALEKGIVTSPNLPMMISQARTIGIFNNPHPNMHLTSAYAAISSAYVDIENSNFEEMKSGFDKAYNKIISEVGRPFISEGNDEEIFAEGQRLAEGQPELAYAAAKSLLLAGEFENNLAGKTLAENLVRGAETLAPDHFNVHGVLYSDIHPINQEEHRPQDNISRGWQPSNLPH